MCDAERQFAWTFWASTRGGGTGRRRCPGHPLWRLKTFHANCRSTMPTYGFSGVCMCVCISLSLLCHVVMKGILFGDKNDSHKRLTKKENFFLSSNFSLSETKVVLFFNCSLSETKEMFLRWINKISLNRPHALNLMQLLAKKCSFTGHNVISSTFLTPKRAKKCGAKWKGCFHETC